MGSLPCELTSLVWPAQGVIKGFFADYDKYPHQEGSSLSAAGINYNSLKEMELMKKLQSLSPPN